MTILSNILLPTAVGCYLLAKLMYRESEFLNRILSGAVFAVLEIATCTLHPAPCTLHSALCIAMLFPLFGAYHRGDAPVQHYLVYLVLGLLSMAWNGFLLMILFLVPVHAIQRTLTLKNIAASILGTLTPWLWIWGVAALCTLHPTTCYLLPATCYLLPTILCIVFIFCAWHYNKHRHRDRSRTRDFYQSIIILGSGTFLMMLVFPSRIYSILPVTVVFCSVLISRFIESFARR